MASTIQLKTGTGSAVPSSLTQGEVAINVDNGLIYYGSGSVNSVKQLESFTHITASNNISASGTITASGFLGDGSGLTNITAAAPAGTVSSSAQISTDISGSFTVTSASFSTRIVANEAITAKTLISSSAQITGSSLLLSHITASGNISASGNLIGVDITSNRDITSGRNITATGNISASGHLHASLSADTDNSVVIYKNGRLYTDEIDEKVWGSNGALLSVEASELADVTVGTATTATSATNITAVATTDNAEFFIGVLDGASGTQAVETSTKLKQNPSTGKITITGDVSSSGTIISNVMTPTTITNVNTTHITASSNISASGRIVGNRVYPNGFSSQPFISTANGQIKSSTGFIGTNITSSNISASGNIIASNVFLPGTGIISFDNSLDGTDQFIKGQDNNIVIDGDDLIKLKADDHVQFVDNSNDVFVAINPNAGHITSSGNISASGTIYGRQWEQIETNLTANIGSLSSGHDGDDFIFLPWTDTDTENAGSSNKFVNRVAVAPGKPIKTSMRATSNALGDTAYTMSLWENKTDQGNNNLVLVTEACGDSTGTNREVVTFDWTNPCSGSNVDITYGSKMWMGIKTTNGNATYAITHLWEWDYGSL